MSYHNYEKETAWKIIYTEFEGVTRRAVELLSTEMGEALNREEGVYVLHVLPLEKESERTNVGMCAAVVGAYDKSPIIQRYVTREESESCDYIIKVVNNPEFNEGTIVLITAKEEKFLYRAAATFLDDYTEIHAPLHGSLRLRREFFKEVIREGSISRCVKTSVRSIFAWGHAINDYREFIRNMARLGLNQLILWNDYAPLNARDIVEYAHSFGIELIWGYAWGWTEEGCSKIKNIDEDTLKRLKVEVLRQYDEIWRGLGDGIYFQSFTEMNKDNIEGRQVASIVTDFVNEVAEEIFKRDPSLHLQFGLHATSVKEHLEEIARVDKRIEIMWEDCGAFPYAYTPTFVPEEAFSKALKFTEDIIRQREGAPIGLVFKGFAILDWLKGKFIHQRGEYILGENTKWLIDHDRGLRSDAWRNYSTGWIRYGEYAKRMAEHIHKLKGSSVNLCMAGAFDGGIWLPEAICAEIFEDPTRDFGETVERVCRRKCVRKD